MNKKYNHPILGVDADRVSSKPIDKRSDRLIIPDIGDLTLEERKFKRKPQEKSHAKFMGMKTKSILSDFEERKKLYERYSMRKPPAVDAPKKLSFEYDTPRPGSGDVSQVPAKCNLAAAEAAYASLYNLPDDRKERGSPQRRRSIIKSIGAARDDGNARIYKSVKFVEKKSLTPLTIKIPLDVPKKAPLKEVGTEMKEKDNTFKLFLPQNRGRMKRRVAVKKVSKRKESPPPIENNGSLQPAEVAKWTPSCLNAHTKPYYEAWVDTTLAAVSKSKGEIYQKQNSIVQSFKKAIEWEPTPQPVYEDLNDERFTGKINIKMKK